jgi:hypothetical protein
MKTQTITPPSPMTRKVHNVQVEQKISTKVINLDKDTVPMLEIPVSQLSGQELVFPYVVKEIDLRDGMRGEDVSYYFITGANALSLILDSISSANMKMDQVLRILDYAWTCIEMACCRLPSRGSNRNRRRSESRDQRCKSNVRRDSQARCESSDALGKDL